MYSAYKLNKQDDNLGDEDFRRRFHAESQAVAMLSHPNIVSVYDVSTSVMADYIVIKAVYYHLVYLTYMQSTSCKMPGWMKHKL